MHKGMRSHMHAHLYTQTKAVTYQHIYSHSNIPEGNDSSPKKGTLYMLIEKACPDLQFSKFEI
jgi:hypothetical protein